MILPQFARFLAVAAAHSRLLVYNSMLPVQWNIKKNVAHGPVGCPRALVFRLTAERSVSVIPATFGLLWADFSRA